MPQSVVQSDNDKIFHRGVQGDGKSISGDGLDGVQCVQVPMKQNVLKGSDQDQGVQCYVLNNVMQMIDYDHMWRSMIEHDAEIQGDQIEMYTSIRSVHGAMTSEIQDGRKG